MLSSYNYWFTVFMWSAIIVSILGAILASIAPTQLIMMGCISVALGGAATALVAYAYIDPSEGLGKTWVGGP